MRAIEQIAMRTLDLDQRIDEIDGLHELPEVNGIKRRLKWIRDQVTAVHVFLHSFYPRNGAKIGDAFKVNLAFNYQIIPSRELELIQLVEGHSIQLWNGVPNEGLSHFGYHIRDGYSLMKEIEFWKAEGFVCAQVSLTVEHTGTARRYLYAFIDTRGQIGTWTKIIARLNQPMAIADAIKEFDQ